MSFSAFRTTARIAALACLMGAATARAGDFIDLRLSFNVTDENVLVKPGETTPSIPGVRIGAPIPRWGTFFFDNYDTRFTGFENLTNMVLYKKVQDGADDFEGAFVLRFNTVSDNLSAIYDGGSYLTWTHWMDPSRVGKLNLSVTAFPMSADRFRLGYSYKLSWGGSPIFFKANPDNPFASTGSSNPAPAPGARVQIGGETGYAFLGAKTSILLNKKINEQESVYGILAGAGVDPTKWLRIEGNGGYFYRGGNPKQEVLGAPVTAYGASAQVAIHQGVPVGRSADFALYKNDASGVTNLFLPEEYPGGLTWLVSSEGTYTQQTLQDPDHPASTVRQPGVAGDINVRVKYNFLRLHADLMYRDLPFLLMNVPSFVPYQAISSNSATTAAETFAAIGADYFFQGPQLTVGVTGGVQVPASFTGQLPTELLGNISAEGLPKSTTVVVRSEGLFDILPPNTKVLPIYAAKLSAMLQRGGFNVLLEVLIANDQNSTHLQRVNNDPEQVSQRVFTNPMQLGFNLAFQAKI
jgi:hypothetical protein